MDRSLPALGGSRLLKGLPATGPEASVTVPSGDRPKIEERQSSDGPPRIHQHSGRGPRHTPFAAEAQPSPKVARSLRGRVRAAAEFDDVEGRSLMIEFPTAEGEAG